MKILFMGTPDFSVPTLEALIQSKHDVVGVVSQPDKPKGRGKQLQRTPVKEVAMAHGIPVYQPNKVREEGFEAIIKALDIDLAIVIAFGQILPKSFLEIPKFGCMNIHASLLPHYRGAGPIQRAIINGDLETGLTTMMMDVGMDTGDMLLTEVVAIEPKETGGSLFEKLSTMGGPLLLRTLEQLEAGTLERIPQIHENATYAPMLDKKLGAIDWGLPAVNIERLIRGLNPWPSAYSFLNEKTLKIWEAQVVKPIKTDSEVGNGTIIAIDQAGFTVKCGEAAILVKSLQLQGKKRMMASDFLRGNPLTVGTKLGNK